MRIAIVAGGRTPERDVSLRGGRRMTLSLTELGHEAWLVDPAEVQLVEALGERRPDLCWLALHGKEGEDGTVQRLLDLLEIPYTGTAAFDCEVAFDKVLAKDALQRAGVPTPPWVVIEGWALRDLGGGAALGKATERVGLPCVVKPSRSGSALGMSFVEREGDLPQAVMAALAFSGAALIEAKVEGQEVAAALAGADLEPLPIVEIVPKEGVYDYAARYTAGATEYFCPARLSEGAAAAVAASAATAAAALHLRDLTRVDLIVDAKERPWVLEVNVSPGMTETSLVPIAAQAQGMSLSDLCDDILRSALRRI
ncbi:MAG: D-alanine--D-alanine ligase [Actinobacteria bacterium]|nr:MAG: D-alanine--D-alanine ligase [Actinomycetota bacterium]